ncbi:hypothetical protein [Sphingomonas sp. URHD0057]|uniref:hypothetical protein n=1 Tax=Sphingomonas sp. URHD0057 TaxID=1380389 RepID=UPI00049058BE|nr:hypothetical protein [Sphingomonas sp. URHD0057]
MRARSALLLLAAICAGPADARPLRAPVVSLGCQGEGCFDRGNWLVTKALPLYARPFAAKALATLPKGTRLTVLGGQIWTTRIGTAVLNKEVANYDPNGKLLIRLPRVSRIRLLYSEGEGYFAGRAADGRDVTIVQDDFRVLVNFRATDWVSVRLADGRRGWIRHDYEALDCSSYYDDSPICLTLNPR